MMVALTSKDFRLGSFLVTWKRIGLLFPRFYCFTSLLINKNRFGVVRTNVCRIMHDRIDIIWSAIVLPFFKYFPVVAIPLRIIVKTILSIYLFRLKTRVPKNRLVYKVFQPMPEYVHPYHFSAFHATIQERAWLRAMVPSPPRICNPNSITKDFVRFKRTWMYFRLHRCW